MEDSFERLRTLGVLQFRIGRLGLRETESFELAVALAEGLQGCLKRAGGPDEVRVEVPPFQRTVVPEGEETRTLLPHHDGGHRSFLTPSLLDVLGWDPRFRIFSHLGEGEGSTLTHKIYQGIFVVDPGNAWSVTTYYPWIEVLALGWSVAHGAPPPSIREVATWLGTNLGRCYDIGSRSGRRYPTLAGAMGGSSPLLCSIAPHCAESGFGRQDLEQFPELEDWVLSCPCGECSGPGARVLCRSLVETVGLSWCQFRSRFEISVVTERHDLVLGHNLILLHGGLRGDSRRLLQPIHLVVEHTEGPGYEAWLAESWRAGVLGAPPPLAEPQCGRKVYKNRQRFHT